MRRDTDQTFGELYNDEKTFKSHLSIVQEYSCNRKDYQNWVQSLRFVTQVGAKKESVAISPLDTASHCMDGKIDLDDEGVSSDSSYEECFCELWPSFDEYERDLELQVTPRNKSHGCRHYVAVSWCWNAEGAAAARGKYLMKGVNRRSKAFDVILDRAIEFAKSRRVNLIWIDQECIDQEDQTDKEAAIQSMDLVYQRSGYPLGLLNAFFDKQCYLDILDCLVQGLEIDLGHMGDLRDVLQKLADDKWFTRAWILQESVSGGIEMTLLARHEPGLDKSIILGRIEGEIETTIEELQHGLLWAEVCVDRAKDNMGCELFQEIKQLFTKIYGFNPTHIAGVGAEHSAQQTKEIYDDQDYRQTCNAAQALSFLRERENSLVPDRLAILANLCNYTVRLNTTEIADFNKSNGDILGFSICALVLALLNGDLSLSLPKSSETSYRSQHVCFCWGPKQDTKVESIGYYEDDEIIVRARPTRILRSGRLRVHGWLWKISEEASIPCRRAQAVLDETTDPKPPELIWSLLKDLMQQNLVELANTLWKALKQYYFGTILDSIGRSKPPRVPRNIEEVLSRGTGELIFRQSGYVEREEDFAQFFHTHNYESSAWLWQSMLRSGRISGACLVSECGTNESRDMTASNNFVLTKHPPTAVFHVGGASTLKTRYVFTPATSLDSMMSLSPRCDNPFSWVIEPPAQGGAFQRCPETDLPVIRGIATCQGYWTIPPDADEPQAYVLE